MGIVAEFETQLLKRAPRKFGQWFPIDLHNHSPTSRDYRGNQSTALNETVEKLAASELKIVMFTDHEALPNLHFISELSKSTGRLILRGSELNVFVDAWSKPEGKVDKTLFFHVLVGFDPAEDADYALKNIYQECRSEERHVSLGFVTCPIRFACRALGLQRREEAFHCCVIPDVTRTTHRADDAVIGHQLLELLAGVLAAAIRVMQQRIGLASPPDRHHQGVGHGDQAEG